MNHRVYAARQMVLGLGRLGFLSLIALTVFSILTGCASVPAQSATVLPAETAVPAAATVASHGYSRHSDAYISTINCHTEPDRNTHPGRRCQSKAHTTPVSDQSARSSGAD